MKIWVKVALVSALFAVPLSLLTMLKPGEAGVETGGGRCECGDLKRAEV